MFTGCLPTFVCVATCLLAATSVASTSTKYNNVLLISVDGMHYRDYEWIVKDRPAGGFAALTARGHTYANAYTEVPSDSFPGTIGLITGGSPKSTGVYYDDSWDRSLFQPTDKMCTGPRGVNTLFDESIDVANYTGAIDTPGTGIDPSLLPRQLLPNGKCVPFYPHEFPRVNNIFDIVHAAGGYTAWSDKHPAYDLVRGKNGDAITDLYTPEQAALTDDTFYSSPRIPLPTGPDKCNGNTPDYTKPLSATAYDELKVQHALDIISKRNNETPAVFGFNFLAVSVAEKSSACGGGYTVPHVLPGRNLQDALRYVDDALLRLIAQFKKHGLWDHSIMVVTAKHGQSPLDRQKLRLIDDGKISDVLADFGVIHVSADDGALIWLNNPIKDTAGAVAALEANKAALGIEKILSGDNITQLWANPNTDARVPTIAIHSDLGVIYTTSTAKIAEHGGMSQNDRHIPLLVAGKDIPVRTIPVRTKTTRVASTILMLLGLDYTKLEAYSIEGRTPFKGLGTGFV